MAKNKKSQLTRIAAFLESGRALTTTQARAMGIQRLSARIHELRNENFPILTTKRVSKGRSVTAYELAD